MSFIGKRSSIAISAIMVVFFAIPIAVVVAGKVVSERIKKPYPCPAG